MTAIIDGTGLGNNWSVLLLYNPAGTAMLLLPGKKHVDFNFLQFIKTHYATYKTYREAIQSLKSVYKVLYHRKTIYPNYYSYEIRPI